MKTNSETNPLLKLNNKGAKIAVAVVVIFVFSLLLGYYFVSRLPPEGYTTINVLSYEQKKAIDYPELLVLNENNTFNIWVEVENHMGVTQSCQVSQKVVPDMISSFPVETNAEKTYTQTLENGEVWETLATVSINDPGTYYVVFELWIYDEQAGTFEFSYNFCVLPLDVVGQT